MQKIISFTLGIALVVGLLSSVGDAFGQNGCAACQKQVQSAFKTCQSQIPARAKDVGNLTDEERKARTDRMEKARSCSTAANEGFANCRRTAGCP